MELLFSYASNLHPGRLKSRLGKVERIGLAKVAGYRLDICVKGGDKSAKATLIETGNTQDEVWGILTSHTAEQIHHLDKLEGTGFNYERVALSVEKESGSKVKAWAYVGKSEYFDKTLKPFEWYLQYIRQGAKEIGLPPAYRMRFDEFRAMPDHDVERNTMHMQILNAY